MNTAEDYEARKQRLRETINSHLAGCLRSKPDSEAVEVARHIVLSGGHRWRGLLAMATGSVFAGEEAERICLPGACSVELAHAASMILDDLPSMDDASMRRGSPCAHLVFSRWAVDMAPAFMISMAYEIALAETTAPAERRIRAALSSAQAAEQMMMGQQQDLSRLDPGCDEATLLECYAWKSGALYGCAARNAAIVTGAAEADIENCYRAGVELGVAYQIMDDVADIEGDLASLGKNPGMDEEDRQTAPRLFGLEGAKRRAVEMQERVRARLDIYGEEAEFLCSLVDRVTWAPV